MEDYLYHKNIFLPLGVIAKKFVTLKDEECDVDATPLPQQGLLDLPVFGSSNSYERKYLFDSHLEYSTHITIGPY
jgi:hypothetical protein